MNYFSINCSGFSVFLMTATDHNDLFGNFDEDEVVNDAISKELMDKKDARKKFNVEQINRKEYRDAMGDNDWEYRIYPCQEWFDKCASVVVSDNLPSVAECKKQALADIKIRKALIPGEVIVKIQNASREKIQIFRVVKGKLVKK